MTRRGGRGAAGTGRVIVERPFVSPRRAAMLDAANRRAIRAEDDPSDYLGHPGEEPRARVTADAYVPRRRPVMRHGRPVPTDFDVLWRRLLDDTVDLAQAARATGRDAEAEALMDCERRLVGVGATRRGTRP